MSNGATLELPLGIRYSINRIINKKRETVDKRVGGEKICQAWRDDGWFTFSVYPALPTMHVFVFFQFSFKPY